MIGQACQYDRRQHRIIHPRLEKWIKRQIPGDEKLRDSLFMYFHLFAQNFVIAQWVSYKKAFVDVINLGGSLNNFNPETAQQFQIQIKSPVGSKELAVALKQKERDRLAQRQAVNDQQVATNERKMSSKLTLSLAGS